MSRRYEIVHTDAEQPFHVRVKAENGNVILSSENYSRKIDARNAAEGFSSLDNDAVIVEVDERTHISKVPQQRQAGDQP